MPPRQPRAANSARTQSLTLLAVLAALVTAVLAGYAFARDQPPTPNPTDRDGNHLPFAISGYANGQLYPGAPPRQLALTLSNPNRVAIFVTALAVTVTASPPGCSAASNLRLTQSSVSSAKPVQVPAKGSVTLPAQGVSAPTIALLDLPVNQNACRGKGFGLAYTGSAHS